MPRQILLIPILFLTLATPLLAADPTLTTASFDSNGIKIAYIESGTGEPVILIHGLYSSAQMNWVAPGTFKLLAQHFHVIAPDLRGHGNSDKPTSEDAYGQPMADDILRLMDHLKIQKAHIVGYSLGSIIVMKLMVDHPDRFLDATEGGFGWLRDGSIEQGVFQRLGGRDASSTPPAAVHGIAKLAVTADQVKQIKLNNEILVGDHDPCRRMYVEPLQAIRPDWPVVIIPDAGHITCIMKQQFKDELEKWLEKNSTSH